MGNGNLGVTQGAPRQGGDTQHPQFWPILLPEFNAAFGGGAEETQHLQFWPISLPFFDAAFGGFFWREMPTKL